MADRERTPEEWEAYKEKIREWVRVHGPDAIKKAVEAAERGDQRMKAAQALPLHGDIIRRWS